MVDDIISTVWTLKMKQERFRVRKWIVSRENTQMFLFLNVIIGAGWDGQRKEGQPAGSTDSQDPLISLFSTFPSQETFLAHSC